MTIQKIPPEVLMRFCARDDSLQHLSRPFLLNGQIFACDLNIAIRLSKTAIAGNVITAKSKEKAEKIQEIINQAKDKQNPFVPFPSLSNPRQGIAVEIDSGIKVSRRYLNIIALLPGAALAPDKLDACYFKFEGGDGVVMPLRLKGSKGDNKTKTTTKILKAIENAPGSTRRDLRNLLPDICESSIDSALWLLTRTGKIYPVPISIESTQEGPKNKVNSYYLIQSPAHQEINTEATPIYFQALILADHSLDVVERTLDAMEGCFA